jgi:hypothetical protein
MGRLASAISPRLVAAPTWATSLAVGLLWIGHSDSHEVSAFRGVLAALGLIAASDRCHGWEWVVAAILMVLPG